MALVIADRVRETTTTTSTGTITLDGAVNGYRSFSVIGNANTTYYCIAHQTANEWEVGVGTYTLSGTTLARTNVLASSNAGSAVNFSAGTKDVFCTNAASTSVVTGKGNTWTSGDQNFGSIATDGVRVGIGANTTNLNGYALNIQKNAVGDGGNSSIAVGANQAIQNDVTNSYISFQAYPSKASGGSTLSNLYQFSSLPNSISTTTTTNFYGFYQASATAPTNIYAAYFNIGAGTGRWNLYIPGTANNYIGGNVGIGTNALGNGEYTIRNTRNVTGNATAYGYSGEHSIQSDVTSAAYGIRTQLSTVTSAFTVPNLYFFHAGLGSKGVSSVITNAYCYYATMGSVVSGAVNGYGFYSAIASGGNRYNFYAGDTAPNLFSGDVLVFGAGKIGYTTGSGGAVTQATSRTTSVTLDKTNGAITLVSAAGSTSWQTFTVINNTVAATDVVHVTQKSGTDKYMIHVTATTAGTFDITFATTGGTTTEQPVFNFAVIKAVIA